MPRTRQGPRSKGLILSQDFVKNADFSSTINNNEAKEDLAGVYKIADPFADTIPAYMCPSGHFDRVPNPLIIKHKEDYSYIADHMRKKKLIPSPDKY